MPSFLGVGSSWGRGCIGLGLRLVRRIRRLWRIVRASGCCGLPGIVGCLGVRRWRRRVLRIRGGWGWILRVGIGWFGWGIFLPGGLHVVGTCAGGLGVLVVGKLLRGILCRVSFWGHCSYRNYSHTVPLYATT